MMRWCQQHGLATGDAIVFEKIEGRRFRLKLEKGGDGAPGIISGRQQPPTG
jgi:hypothetical protein